MQPYKIYKTKEVCDVSIRFGWFGKLIVRVRKNIYMDKFPANGWEFSHISNWKDANSSDPDEVFQIMEILSTRKITENERS